MKFLLIISLYVITLKNVELKDDFAEFDSDIEDSVDGGESEVEINNEEGEVTNGEIDDEFENNDELKQSVPASQEEAEEQDEFDPFADEEEFEGYDTHKDKIIKTKTPSSGLKITKVPIHLRAGWQAFYMELITLFGILVYAANFFTGKNKNSKLATSWFKTHKPLLEQHFSIVGDDGMSKEPQSGVLVKESESVYTLWCTGRQYCEGMLVELRLLKRHDLVSVIANMLKPRSEIIHITVYMDDDEMDNFVFALLPKKQAAKYQKELQDLSFFCGERKPAERFDLSNYSLLSEAGEVSDFLLSTQVCNIIKKYEACFESMHCSDQYVGPKRDEGDEEAAAKLKKPKKVLRFEFKIPSGGRTKAEDMSSTEPLVKMVLFLIDRVKSFKLSQQARAKSDKKRREVEESFLKQSHAQRQEAAQARKDEKNRIEQERLMAEEDPDKQRKLEDKLSKQNAKRRNQKMKSVKVRM